jgi:hypothetical protein
MNSATSSWSVLISGIYSFVKPVCDHVVVHERRLVDQNIASWNPLISWLRLIDRMRAAA